MRYLIKTPGRTGSHILTSYLRNNNINCVHCQEAWLPDDPTNWVFINSKRRNWWDMACSRVITSYTKEYGPYTKKNFVLEPTIESLLDSIAYTKFRYELYDAQQKNYNWAKTITIFYEDILQDIKVLKQIGDFDTNLAIDTSYTSPYQFKDVIKNYEELKKEFDLIIKELKWED
jgi:hypothetical protein